MIMWILVISSAIIVFLEQKKYEKLTGFSSNSALIAFGVLIVWIGVFPYYIFKIREDQRANIAELEKSPYIISKNVGILMLIAGVALFLISFASL